MTELKHVKYSELLPSEDNIRYELTDIHDLMKSIVGSGLHQPLTVSPEGEMYRIIAGHRRHAAIGEAIEGALLPVDWEVPVFVKQYDDTDRRVAMVVENTQRSDLHPLDEAVAYAQLRDDFGLTQKDIAERVGKSQAYVSGRIKSGRLVTGVQQAIRDGRLDFTSALPLADIDATHQSRFIEAWGEGEIPSIKVSTFVRKVREQTMLEAEERALIKKGYNVFYQGSTNNLSDYVPEGHRAEWSMQTAVRNIDELPGGHTNVLLQISWDWEVVYCPISFVEMTGAEEAATPQDGHREALKAQRKHQMAAISEVVVSRPGMQRVDTMLAEMLVRSCTPAAAVTLAGNLGLPVGDDPIWDLLQEVWKDKRTAATIGVVAGLLMASPTERNDYLANLLDSYSPFVVAEEDPF